jgi:zinc/manganese transport system substrate-binding protein
MNFHRKFAVSLLLGAAALLSASAHAALNVLACEPEWEALTKEIGGDKVKVSSATNALQDPHRIEARPGLIARTRNADLLVCTGLVLEAGAFVPRLDIPGKLDRSEGDVHAAGNPHIQQNPRNIALVAIALSKRLAEIDPANAAVYQSRHADFAARWSAAMLKWEKQAAPLRGVAVVEHHKNMEYLMNWLGMRQVGTLEAKPGVEPSAAHLCQLLAQLQREPAKMVLRAAYQDARASQWLSERAKIPAVALPFTVGGDDKANDLFGLFDVTVARLLDANK